MLAECLDDFQHWAIKIPRFDSNHRAILVELDSDPLSHHWRYIIDCKQSTTGICLPQPLGHVDQLFKNLMEFKKLQTVEMSRDHSWIAQDT